MKELFFVRHGQTEWNAIRRMQGQWNSNLSELGKTQADINGKFLSTLDIKYLVSSPLDRTMQTTKIINKYLKLDINYDKRIMEWDCGDWSGEMWDNVSQKWPEEFAAWQANQFFYRGPNCENYPDMIKRVSPFLEEILNTAYERIAIISHGVIGRVMVSTLLKHSPEDILLYGQSNDTVFHLTEKKTGFDAQHFVGAQGPRTGLSSRNY